MILNIYKIMMITKNKILVTTVKICQYVINRLMTG